MLEIQHHSHFSHAELRQADFSSSFWENLSTAAERPFGFWAIIWRCSSNELPLARINQKLSGCWWKNINVLLGEIFSARNDYMYYLLAVNVRKNDCLFCMFSILPLWSNFTLRMFWDVFKRCKIQSDFTFIFHILQCIWKMSQTQLIIHD